MNEHNIITYIQVIWITEYFQEQKRISILLLLRIYCRIVFCHFFLMNLVLWYEDSSAAIPFLTLVALLALWFGVSVPLTFVGAFFGFRKRPIEHPVRTNQIPRQVPDQSCYTQVGRQPIFLTLLFVICGKATQVKGS